MHVSSLEQELVSIDLGDRRLDERATRVLSRLFESPHRSPNAAMANHAEMTAAYRLFDHEQCTAEALLQAHRAAVLERVRQHARVLVIQDTTELDYTRHANLEGKGPLSTEFRRGIFAHIEWVISEERLALGTWRCHFHVRDAEQIGTVSSRRKQLSIEGKESYRWLQGYRSACELAEQAPGVTVISCSDREGDLYEVFAEWRQRQEQHRALAQWLIRSRQNRRLRAFEDRPLVLGVEARLFEQLARSPVLGTIEFEVSTKTQFHKLKGSRRRSVRQGREVRMQIRTAQIVLRPPFRSGRRLPEVTVGAVMASEIDPPAGQKPIEWILLTSLPVRDFDDATTVVELYRGRWEIEVLHRVLKTGCRVERLQFETLERLEPAIAMYLIVAWRILYLLKLGRQCPELPCAVVFEEAEWKSLCVVVRGKPPPREPPSLGDVILMIARFGGYKGRKCDGPPGPEAMWQGYQSLRCFSMAWRCFGPDSS